MKHKKRYLFTGLVLILAPMLFIQSAPEVQVDTARIPEKVIPTNPHLQDFINEYDSIIQNIIHKTLGAAIVIVKGGSIIFSKGYGVKSSKTRESIDTNTVFRIGSVSKGFASVLTGILSQEGILDFEAV